MPLPFLKPKKVAGLIISQRNPDGGTEQAHEEGDENHELNSCARDLIRAISDKDENGVAAALRAAYEICDSYPENQEDSNNDYDSQNIKAAEQERE